MALPHRTIFRPGQSYVAVRRIRLGEDRHIEPGELIEGFPRWRLKSWYSRGLIGVDGDAWTEWQLTKLGARLEREQRRVPKRRRETTAGAGMLSSIREALSGPADPEDPEEPAVEA